MASLDQNADETAQTRDSESYENYRVTVDNKKLDQYILSILSTLNFFVYTFFVCKKNYPHYNVIWPTVRTILKSYQVILALYPINNIVFAVIVFMAEHRILHILLIQR